MPHDAFISYSHESDRTLAPAIQRALHRFAKPWYQMRALKVFLDSTSLSASAGLGPAIEKALGDAGWFLLMASPLSAQSRWVRQEVAWWLEHRPPERMLILLTDGELAWDPQARDFDWSRTTAVPRELSGRFVDEPLYVDFRWARTEPGGLTLRGGRFRSAILDIAAPLHGRPKDELDGDDVRQHRRTRLVSAAAVLLILVGAVAAGWQAYAATLARHEAERSAIEAREQRDVAERERGRAENQQKIAEAEKKTADRERDEAQRQRTEAERQRAEAQRQRDAALGSLLRAEAERLEAVGQLDAALLLALESTRYSRTPDIYETVYRVVANRATPIYDAPPPVEFSIVSADGRRAAIVDHRHVVVVDLDRSQPLLTIAEPRIMRARFSPDGAALALVNDAAEVKIFALPHGTLRATLTNARKAETWNLPNLSEDGSLVAVASDGVVRIIETFSGQVVFEGSHTDRIVGAFPADRGRAAVVTASGERGVLSSRGFVAMPSQRRSAVRHVSASPGTDLIAFKFADPAEEVVLWNSRSGEAYAAAGPNLSSAAFNARGDRVALGYQDGTVIVRTLPASREIARFKFNYTVSVLKNSPDGRRLVAVSSDTRGFATIHRIDTTGWLRVGSAEVVPANFVVGSNSEVVIDAGGARVAAGRSILEFQDGVRRGWREPPASLEQLAPSQDWKRLAGVVGKSSVVVVDTDSGKPVSAFGGCASFGPPALSADGARLAVRCEDSKDLRVYDLRNGRMLGSVEDAHRTPLAFAPAGDRLASGDRILSVSPLRTAGVIYPGLYQLLAFGPDGRRALIAGGGGFAEAALHHAMESGEDRRTTRRIEPGIVDSLAYSRDGTRAAAAFRGNPDIRIYRTADWARTLVSQKEEGARLSMVTALAFSPDGRLLASVSQSQRDQTFRWFVTLRVFDVASGAELIRAPLSQPALGLRFASDNRVVQVLGGNPVLEQQDFPLDVRRWVPAGCARVRQQLTREQWNLYLPGIDYRLTCQTLNPAAGRLTTGT